MGSHSQHRLGALVRASRVIVVAAVAVGAMVLGVSSSGAQSGCAIQWTGTAGTGLWQTPGNWSTNELPTSADHVCLPDGAVVQVTSGEQAAASIGGSGSVEISSSTLTLSDADTRSTVRNLTISSGTLTGPGSVDVTGGLRWTNGTMSGSGETFLAAGSESSIEPDYSVALSGRKLRNAGALTWVAGTIQGSNAAEDRQQRHLARQLSAGQRPQRDRRDLDVPQHRHARQDLGRRRDQDRVRV